jgi:PAS domain S-box-containing protein
MIAIPMPHSVPPSSSLQQILDLSLDVICTIDNDGKFVMLSAASKKVFGYAPRELIGKSFIDFVVPEDHPKSIAIGEEIKKGKPVRIFTNRYLKKDGTVADIMWSAHWEASEGLMYCVAKDITEKRRSENELKEKEHLYRSLVQSGNDMMAIISGEGIYTYVAPTVEKVLGYLPEELVGKNFMEFIHPDYLPLLTEKLQEVLQSEEAMVSDFRFKAKDGRWIYLETVGTNHLKDPLINGIVANSRDVTERKRLDKEKTLLIEELQRTIQDLKQFSYITSHNLRSPVANLQSLLGLCKTCDIQDPYLSLLIEKSEESAMNLNNVISDLMQVLMIKGSVNIEKENISIVHVVEKVAKTIEHLIAGSNAKININTDTNAQVWFNRSYLESIFLNLLTNAIKYSDSNKDVHITIDLSENEMYDIVTFTDNGIGIDLSKHGERIFGMYQRFHHHPDSKGLGLFLVKSQMNALEGDIRVESEVGKFTTFILSFKKQTSE